MIKIIVLLSQNNFRWYGCPKWPTVCLGTQSHFNGFTHNSPANSVGELTLKHLGQWLPTVLVSWTHLTIWLKAVPLNKTG